MFRPGQRAFCPVASTPAAHGRDSAAPRRHRREPNLTIASLLRSAGKRFAQAARFLRACPAGSSCTSSLATPAPVQTAPRTRGTAPPHPSSRGCPHPASTYQPGDPIATGSRAPPGPAGLTRNQGLTGARQQTPAHDTSEGVVRRLNAPTGKADAITGLSARRYAHGPHCGHPLVIGDIFVFNARAHPDTVTGGASTSRQSPGATANGKLGPLSIVLSRRTSVVFPTLGL